MASPSFLLPPGLREIFRSRPLLDAFHEFTASMCCEENLQFIEDVLLLKASQNLAAINYIFITYIASNSPLQVNIDAAVRLATADRFNRLATMTPTEQLSVYDQALSQVAEVVERDSAPKFLQQRASSQTQLEITQPPSLLHQATDTLGWYRGHLLRRNGFFGQWSPFTYLKKGSYLFEFKPGANHIKAEPLTTIPLDGSLVETARILTRKPNTFILHTKAGKSYFFQSESKEDMERWMEELCTDNSLTKQLRASKPLTPPALSAPLPPNPNEEAAQQPKGVLPKEMLAAAMPFLNFIFLDSFEEAVVASDSTGTIVTFNHAAEKMFGFTQAEALGQPVRLIISEPYQSENVDDMFRLGTSGEPRVVPGRRKNGEIFRLVISLAELPLPGYFVVIFRE